MPIRSDSRTNAFGRSRKDIGTHSYSPRLYTVKVCRSSWIAQGAVVEHRGSERLQVEIPVRLSVRPYAIGAGIISNLSLSGAWIRTNLKVPALARIDITFP